MSRIVKWWKDFLERLGKASEAEFHNRPPSCCADLPKQRKLAGNASVGKRDSK
jgi:hypothetical protein